MSQGPDSLTVVFEPASADQNIETLSSLTILQAFELLWPECILEIMYNTRISVIAVETRNGQTSRALIYCTNLCGMAVNAYEPIFRTATSAVS